MASGVGGRKQSSGREDYHRDSEMIASNSLKSPWHVSDLGARAERRSSERDARNQKQRSRGQRDDRRSSGSQGARAPSKAFVAAPTDRTTRNQGKKVVSSHQAVTAAAIEGVEEERGRRGGGDGDGEGGGGDDNGNCCGGFEAGRCGLRGHMTLSHSMPI